MASDDFPKTPRDFFDYAKKNQAEMVDLKFVDMLGSWQHCSYPIDHLDEGTFEEGLGFDGSSIRGWMGIHESDMMAVPVAETTRLDPFYARPTVSVIANVVDPITRKDFSRDPRNIARKAEAYLKASGVADTCFIGPEPEFFIFDEAHHHEVATAGQSEIDMQFMPLLKMADQFMWYKYICKNVAKRNGKTVTFMPKPIFEDNGSGMHSHTSLWKGGKPLFAGDGYAGLSEMGLWAAGGLLKHAPAILAFAAPTTNSYRRLVPGFEAPVNLAISARNRSASIRIPMYSKSPKSKRLEFRCPDPSANGYLAWPAMLMAMLDGIQNKIDPGKPLDRDIYEMTREEMKQEGIRTTPGSLSEAIDALEADHAFLTKGGVFTDDLISTWIDYKRAKELDPMRLRPHPYEFYLYYDN